jgi:hypothetical protein
MQVKYRTGSRLKLIAPMIENNVSLWKLCPWKKIYLTRAFRIGNRMTAGKWSVPTLRLQDLEWTTKTRRFALAVNSTDRAGSDWTYLTDANNDGPIRLATWFESWLLLLVVPSVYAVLCSVLRALTSFARVEFVRSLQGILSVPGVMFNLSLSVGWSRAGLRVFVYSRMRYGVD